MGIAVLLVARCHVMCVGSYCSYLGPFGLCLAGLAFWLLIVGGSVLVVWLLVERLVSISEGRKRENRS